MFCNRTIKSSNEKGVSKNFYDHVKTHGFTSSKTYKEWVRDREQSQQQQQPAQRPMQQPQFDDGGFGDGGFGDDDFGGGGGGGGGGDQGAHDPLFDDAEDEEDLKSLDVALKHKGTRAVLMGIEMLWMSAADRVTKGVGSKSMVTYLGQAASVLPLLALNEGEPLPASVGLLEEGATQADIDKFAYQVVRALESLVSVEQWGQRCAAKKIGSVAVALLFLRRLTAWALGKTEMKLASALGIGQPPPAMVVKARSVIAGANDQAIVARKKSLFKVRAKRAALAKQSDTWLAVAEALKELAEFKQSCEGGFEKLETEGETLDEFSLEELRALAIAALVGYADFPALRINVGNCKAGDASKPGVVEHEMTVLRVDGKLRVQVVEGQKGHIMAPIEIDNAAPLVARVLHKLLDHEEFVHGGAIVAAKENSLLKELQAAGELADFDDPPGLLVSEGVKGLPIEANTMRRWHATVAWAALLCNSINVEQYVGLCYVQQHDPRTSLRDYMMLDGLKELVPDKWKSAVDNAHVTHQQMTARDTRGNLPQQQHNKLARVMWRCLARLRLFGSKLRDGDCPVCSDKVDDLASHLAQCLGNLDADEAANKLEIERRERIEALKGVDYAPLAPDDDGDESQRESDDDDDGGEAGGRKAKKRALNLIDAVAKLSRKVRSKADDSDDDFAIELSSSASSELTSSASSELSSSEEGVRLPLKLLAEFEAEAKGQVDELLAFVLGDDKGAWRLLFVDQVRQRTGCQPTEHGNAQLGEQISSDFSVKAWVHSHPGHDQFLSHIDVHSQAEWQAILPDIVALVWAPDRGKKWAAYYIEDENAVKRCARAHGAAQLHQSCKPSGKVYCEVRIVDTVGQVEVVDRRDE